MATPVGPNGPAVQDAASAAIAATKAQRVPAALSILATPLVDASPFGQPDQDPARSKSGQPRQTTRPVGRRSFPPVGTAQPRNHWSRKAAASADLTAGG